MKLRLNLWMALLLIALAFWLGMKHQERHEALRPPQ